MLTVCQDKDYTVESVTIPRRYHRTLLGEKGIFIHDIETKTNSVFRFPYKETASDVVTIFGPESQLHIAAAMLLVSITPQNPRFEPSELTYSPGSCTFRGRPSGAAQSRTLTPCDICGLYPLYRAYQERPSDCHCSIV